MRSRRSLLAATAVVGCAALAASGTYAAATGSAPKTPGPFHFATVELGATPAYGEPSMDIAPDGVHRIISTPGADGDGKGTVQYWYSADGSSWHHSSTTAPNGGGDSEVEFLPDGSLLSADLEISDSYIQRSTDFGKTWTAVGPAGTEQDRQWFAHTPDGSKAFLVYHDFVSESEMYAASTDGGKTWSQQDCCNLAQSQDQLTAPGAAQTPRAGDPASLLDQGVNTFSGPMLVAPNGKDFYVVYSISDLQSNLDPRDGVPPFGPTRGVVVQHSPDAGKTWESHYAVVAPPQPSDAPSEPVNGAIFPWASIDKAGNVYVVYNSTRGVGGENFHQWYVYSSDQGKTWSHPVRLDRLGRTGGAALYATSDAGDPGVLDVAWYQTDKGAPSDDSSLWRVHFAQVRDADTPHPHVRESAVSGVPNHKGGICLQGILCGIGPGSSDRSLLDFFQVKINPVTGYAEIAYADNYRLSKDGKQVGEVVYARQTSGPRAR